MDLSVIILNYNTPDLTRRCLQAVFGSQLGKYSKEVIVVDNGSNEKLNLKNLRVIRNTTNLGFAGGNNVGLRVAKGRYALLLNSDTEVAKDSLRLMIEFMDSHGDVGASTCKVLLPDGSLDPACHRGFPTPWASMTYFLGLERLFPRSRIFGQYHQLYKDLDQPHEIDSPSGAFFMARREVIDLVGLLDESFFMYGEDLDWAYRIKQKGWKIMFVPGTSILHKKKQSGRASRDPNLKKMTDRYFYQTMLQFYHKHYARRYSPLITLLVELVIRVRMIISL